MRQCYESNQRLEGFYVCVLLCEIQVLLSLKRRNTLEKPDLSQIQLLVYFHG